MKKMIVSLLVLAAVGVNADYYVSVDSAGGFTTTVGLTPNIGDQVLVQLIYAGADNTANAADATQAGYVSGDDQLIQSFIFENTTGDSFGEFAIFALNYEGAYLGANVYGRIFQDTTPNVGDSYFAGNIVSVTDQVIGGSPSPTRESVQINTDTVNGNDLTMTVIPEPATLSLMGIATAGSFLARRKRRGGAVKSTGFGFDEGSVSRSFLEEESSAMPLGHF